MIKKILEKSLLPKIYKIYLSINLKTREFILNENDKCLLLAPHADDESIGAGGTLLKHGRQFDVICLTNGIKGVKNLEKNKAASIRKDEFSDAMNFAAVNSFEMLDIEDKSLVLGYEQFKTIDLSNYDYIFIPNILDQHQDHKAVSLNLEKLIKDKPHKKDLKIVMYEVWSALALPNAFVNISDVHLKKRELIQKHKSQIASKDYTAKALALNEYRGLPHNLDFAEAFSILDLETFNTILRMAKII